MDLDAMIAEHQATYRALCDTSGLPVDVPAWVAETRRLRDENARLRDENARLRDENARLRDENARLRAGADGRALWEERARWVEDIEEAIGDWGGPERETFTAALLRIKAQVGRRLGAGWEDKLP